MKSVQTIVIALFASSLVACAGESFVNTSGNGGQAGAGGSSAGAAGASAGSGGSDAGSGGSGAGAGGSDAGAGGSAGGAGGSAAGVGGSAAGSAGAGPTACTPYDATTTCEEGFTCLSESHDGSAGVCKKNGTKKLGSSCPTQLVHTGCTEGLVCAEEPHGNHAHPTCRRICDPLAATTGCSGSQLCTAGYLLGGKTGACLGEYEDAQAAALGEPCTKSPKKGSPCAPEAGVKYHGACVPEGDAFVCRALCAVGGEGCGAPGSCQDALGLGGLGVCAP